jgi:uncharacterized MAPEG superfamily protein
MTIAEWCVLAAGLMPVVFAGIAKGGTALDNHNPRDWAASLVGYRRRAYAAHYYAFEAFPPFAAAVVVAEMNDARQALVNALALTFIAARLVYAACYLADRATARSLVWTIGWLLTIAIFTLPLWR